MPLRPVAAPLGSDAVSLQDAAPATPSSHPVHTVPAVLTDAPVLAHVVRGGFVESAHRASVAVVDAAGSDVLVLGDGRSPVFPRSSNKPLQALAMVRAGLTLDPPHLALACASHSGEPFHLEGVRQILERFGLGVEDLQNPPDLPYDERERTRRIAAGDQPSSLFQNCSGKHAAMLATCIVNDWPTATYLEPSHPLQRAVADTLAELAAEPIAAVAVDGCGAPVMAVSLHGLAHAFGILAAAPAQTPEGLIAAAMRAHPENVGGTTRDVTRLMRGTPGAIAKDGAESVYAVGLADGRGIALKVADGGQRARPVILAEVLTALGVESTAYDCLRDAPILGHGEPVGAVVGVPL